MKKPYLPIQGLFTKIRKYVIIIQEIKNKGDKPMRILKEFKVPDFKFPKLKMEEITQIEEENIEERKTKKKKHKI